MEYKIFYKIRQKIKIPYYLRVILGIFSIIFGILLSIIPPVPGFIFVITGILFLIPVEKIKEIRKIRKGLIHFFKNIHCTKMMKMKFFDFWTHLKKIFSTKKRKKIFAKK